jgi:hypothetical protein
MKLAPLRPRQPLSGLALSAVAGIVAADCWETCPGWALAFAAAGAAAALFRPRMWACWVAVFTAFFALHTLRHHGSEARRLAAAFEAGPRTVVATGIVGSEPQPTHTPSRWTSGSFRLRLESIEIAGALRASDAVVHIRWAGSLPAYGDRIRITGAGSNLAPPRNPGEFDRAAYERRQGVYSEIRSRHASDCEIIGHGHGNGAMALGGIVRWTRRRSSHSSKAWCSGCAAKRRMK